MSDVVFLLWSNKHSMWWAPEACGYTSDIDEAGRYTEAEAVKRVVRSAYHGDLSQVTSMVAAPDNWAVNESGSVPRSEIAPQPSGIRLVAGPGPLLDVLSEALPKLAAEKAARRARACDDCYGELREQFDAFPETYCQHRRPDGAS